MDPCPKHGTHMDSCWDCCEEHWQDRIAELEAQLASLREYMNVKAVELHHLTAPHDNGVRRVALDLVRKAQEGYRDE